MKQTVALNELGLVPDDLNREARAAAEAAAEEQRRRNSISFSGDSFDTSSTQFAADFAAVAFERFGGCDWRSRSSIRTVALKDMGEPAGAGSGGAGGGRGAKPKPPEHVRTAMGLAGEVLAYHYLKAKHPKLFHDGCWMSASRRSIFPEDGDDSLGYDFAVNTTETEWVYEVKASPSDACEFELTDNEYRTAAAAAVDKGRRYRILMVQHVFDPDRCRVIELPNPTGPMRSKFRIVGRSSARMRFQPQ
jgi:hypothetical protein